MEDTTNLPVPIPGVALTTAETSSSAVAAQAKALVEARFLVAINRPRNWDGVRVRLLQACKRPGFAETAMYQKPVGREKITGPSIRFVEEALRACTNVLAESTVVYDDDEKRIIRVTVTDLEANLSYPQDVVIAKTIERKQPQKGAEIIRARANSKGETVYIIRATDDDMITKQAALVSKAIRTCGLRCLPSDIVEEAVAQVQETIRTGDSKDPTAARKRVADLFYAQGVMPEDLEKFLGHPLGQTTPAELGQLRLMHQALKEGEATWAAFMEEKLGTRSGEGNGGGNGAAKTGTAGLAETLKGKAPAPAPAAAAVEDDVSAQDQETLRLDAEREQSTRRR